MTGYSFELIGSFRSPVRVDIRHRRYQLRAIRGGQFEQKPAGFAVEQWCCNDGDPVPPSGPGRRRGVPCFFLIQAKC